MKTIITTCFKLINFCMFINLLLLQSCTKSLVSPSVLQAPASSLSTSGRLSASASSTRNFISGVNGHALNQKAYLSTPADVQTSLLNTLHLTYYRIDISTNENGVILQNEKFNELVSSAKVHNVKILPMLYTTGLDYKLDVNTAFHKGYLLGQGFSKKYGQYFDYYEMGNELDWEVLIDRTKYGANIEDYDMKKCLVMGAFFNGMNEGIKTGDPDAKTIIDACTSHIGFFKILKQLNINFDVIGDHFYLDADNSIPWYEQAIKATTALFNNTKPVWITECNKWKGSYENTEALQNTLVSSFFSKCKSIPNIEAIFIYELLDEPELPTGTNFEIYERNFGLVKWISTYSKFDNKALANTLQNQ